jgi:hypothetical protein
MTWPYPQTPAIHAASGGASLPSLASLMGGDPTAIMQYVGQLVQHSQRLVQLIGELDKKKQELRDVWPQGTASDQAGESTASTLDTFIQAIAPMTAGAQALTGVATSLRGAQAGYSGAMTATEPVVQSLMSNPFTQGAGVATAMGVAGQVKTFLTGIGTLLTSLGLKDIGAAFTQLGTIVGSVESVFNSITGQSGDAGQATSTGQATTDTGQPTSTTTAGYDTTGSSTTGSDTTGSSTTGSSTTGSSTTGSGAPVPSSTPATGLDTGAGSTAGGYGSAAGLSTGSLGTGGLSAGSPMAFTTDPSTGMPYGYGIDTSTGQLYGTGVDPQTGLPLGSGSGAGLADSWVPVDPGASGGPESGGGAGSSGAGSGGAGSGGDGAGGGAGSDGTSNQANSASGDATDWTQGDDTTHIQVSSGGETVSFDIDAGNDETTITAAVGPDGDQSNVEITVAPQAV